MILPWFGLRWARYHDQSLPTASKRVKVTPKALLLLLWTEAGELKRRFP
jgi:hypothetical protein